MYPIQQILKAEKKRTLCKSVFERVSRFTLCGKSLLRCALQMHEKGALQMVLLPSTCMDPSEVSDATSVPTRESTMHPDDVGVPWRIQRYTRKFLFEKNFYHHNREKAHAFIRGCLTTSSVEPESVSSVRNEEKNIETDADPAKPISKRRRTTSRMQPVHNVVLPDASDQPCHEDQHAMTRMTFLTSSVNPVFVVGRFARLEIIHHFLIRECKKGCEDRMVSSRNGVPLPSALAFFYERLTVFEYFQVYVPHLMYANQLHEIQTLLKDKMDSVLIGDLLRKTNVSAVPWRRMLGLARLYGFRLKWLEYYGDLLQLGLLERHHGRIYLQLTVNEPDLSMLSDASSLTSDTSLVQFPLTLTLQTVSHHWRHMEYMVVVDYATPYSRIRTKDVKSNSYLPMKDMSAFRVLWEFPHVPSEWSVGTLGTSTRQEQRVDVSFLMEKSQQRHVPLGLLLSQADKTHGSIDADHLEPSAFLVTLAWYFYPWPGCLLMTKRLALDVGMDVNLQRDHEPEGWMASLDVPNMMRTIVWIEGQMFGPRTCTSMTAHALLRREKLARQWSSVEMLLSLVHRVILSDVQEESRATGSSTCRSLLSCAGSSSFLTWKSMSLRYDKLYALQSTFSETRRRALFYTDVHLGPLRNDILFLQCHLGVDDGVLVRHLAESPLYGYTDAQLVRAITWRNHLLLRHLGTGTHRLSIQPDDIQVILSICKFHGWIVPNEPRDPSDADEPLWQISDRLLAIMQVSSHADQSATPQLAGIMDTPLTATFLDSVIIDTVMKDTMDLGIVLQRPTDALAYFDTRITLHPSKSTGMVQEIERHDLPPLLLPDVMLSAYGEHMKRQYIDTHPGISLLSLQLLLWPWLHPMEVHAVLEFLLHAGTITRETTRIPRQDHACVTALYPHLHSAQPL
jgi:hypothetical protein